uniref:C-type lectin domain-containing protein n=1 Tax=Steinernema glaseri TaxID=37863 RepID=A0A1I7YI34_9BILA
MDIETVLANVSFHARTVNNNSSTPLFFTNDVGQLNIWTETGFAGGLLRGCIVGKTSIEPITAYLQCSLSESLKTGHVNKIKENYELRCTFMKTMLREVRRWSDETYLWTPTADYPTAKRPLGHPRTRWEDDWKKISRNWRHWTAEDWDHIKCAYVRCE